MSYWGVLYIILSALTALGLVRLIDNVVNTLFPDEDE